MTLRLADRTCTVDKIFNCQFQLKYDSNTLFVGNIYLRGTRRNEIVMKENRRVQ